MNVKINEEVLTYLQKKNRTVVTLQIQTMGGGWCGSTKVQVVGHEKPSSLEGYTHFNVSGIDVYIYKNVLGEALVFQIQRTFFFKSVYAAGIDPACLRGWW